MENYTIWCSGKWQGNEIYESGRTDGTASPDMVSIYNIWWPANLTIHLHNTSQSLLLRTVDNPHIENHRVMHSGTHVISSQPFPRSVMYIYSDACETKRSVMYMYSDASKAAALVMSVLYQIQGYAGFLAVNTYHTHNMLPCVQPRMLEKLAFTGISKVMFGNKIRIWLNLWMGITALV